MTRKQTIRLQIMLEDIELDVIDSWRFLNDMPSRGAAIRELIHRGLTEEGFKSAQGGVSERYGIVHSPQTN